MRVINLHPEGATSSEAYGVSRGQQVGRALFDGVWCAILWNGSADSWVNLTPAGMEWSEAYSVHCGQQVGIVQVHGMSRAILWNGSADSWVDLTPARAA
jgi:hypothetical protein